MTDDHDQPPTEEEKLAVVADLEARLANTTESIADLERIILADRAELFETEQRVGPAATVEAHEALDQLAEIRDRIAATADEYAGVIELLRQLPADETGTPRLEALQARVDRLGIRWREEFVVHDAALEQYRAAVRALADAAQE